MNRRQFLNLGIAGLTAILVSVSCTSLKDEWKKGGGLGEKYLVGENMPDITHRDKNHFILGKEDWKVNRDVYGEKILVVIGSDPYIVTQRSCNGKKKIFSLHDLRRDILYLDNKNRQSDGKIDYGIPNPSYERKIKEDVVDC